MLITTQKIGKFCATASLAGCLAMISAPAATAQFLSSDDISVDLSFFVGDAAVNIRTGPGANYPLHGVYQVGHQVHVYEKRGKWARISGPNERPLWVTYDLLTKDPPPGHVKNKQKGPHHPSNLKGKNGKGNPHR